MHHSVIDVGALSFPSAFSVVYIFRATRRKAGPKGADGVAQPSKTEAQAPATSSLLPAPTQNHIYLCEKRFSKIGKEKKEITNLSDATKQEETEVDIALSHTKMRNTGVQVGLSNLLNTLNLQVSYLLLKPVTRLRKDSLLRQQMASAKKPHQLQRPKGNTMFIRLSATQLCTEAFRQVLPGKNILQGTVWISFPTLEKNLS